MTRFAIDTTLQKGQQPRIDYRKFFELIILFLDGIPPKNIRFHGPGEFCTPTL